MTVNKLGMYSEVERTKENADTAVDSAARRELVIPLSRLRRQSVKLPSTWISLRIWLSVKLAEFSAWMAP